MTTTSMMKERTGLLLRSNSLELMNAARIMIAMLMTLLVTRMVLSSLSGFARSFMAADCLLPLRCWSSSMSPGVREKYATSEPEMKADAIIRRIRTIISVPRATGDPVTAARAIIPVNEPAGSVSKIIRVGYLEGQVICSVMGGEVFNRSFSC